MSLWASKSGNTVQKHLFEKGNMPEEFQILYKIVIRHRIL